MRDLRSRRRDPVAAVSRDRLAAGPHPFQRADLILWPMLVGLYIVISAVNPAPTASDTPWKPNSVARDEYQLRPVVAPVPVTSGQVKQVVEPSFTVVARPRRPSSTPRPSPTLRPTPKPSPVPRETPRSVFVAVTPDSVVKKWALGQVGRDQYTCLDAIFTRESHWNPLDQNPATGAYGIPQAVPGSKMASAGADWQTNPITQVRWGLGYIHGRYGSPCNAWAYWQANGWY